MSRPAILIATSGVAIGILVMILSISIVLGFKKEIQNKIAGMCGYVQVMNYESLYNSEPSPILFSDSLMKATRKIGAVTNIQRFCTKSGMMKTDESFHGITLKGIEEGYDTMFLSSNIKEGRVGDILSKNSTSILISSKISQLLKLQVGDEVYSYFFDQNLRVRKFTISGIYSTNMSDMDSRLVYCNLSTVQKIMHWESNQYACMEIVTDRYDNLETVLDGVYDLYLHRQDGEGAYYAVAPVTEIYPQIFSWLNLLDTNILAILILMICVAGVTMVSGLLIIILDKTQFIGVMKAMGATNRQMRRLFLYFASMIVVRGLVIGNVLGIAFIIIQKYTGIIGLDAETYYVDRVPVAIDIPDFVIVNIITLVVCILVLIIPSYIVGRIHPATSIRFE